MSITIAKGNIGNALHSVAPEHVVATADEIFDETAQQYQDDINAAVDADIAQLDGIQDDIAHKVLPCVYLPENFLLKTDNKYDSSSTKQCFFIPVRGGESYTIEAPYSNSIIFAFVKSKPAASQDVADYATGGSRTTKSALQSATGTVPSDAKYLYVTYHNGDTYYTPKSIVVGGYSYIDSLPGLRSAILDINSRLKDLVFEGANNGTVTQDIYSVIAGRTYQFNVANPSWAINNITLSGGNTILQITARDSSGTQIDSALYNCSLNNYPCDATIKVTMPSGTAFVRVIIRANAGELVRMSITDVTEIETKASTASVTALSAKVDNRGKFVSLSQGDSMPNISVSNRTLTIPKRTVILYNDAYYIIPYGSGDTDVVVDLSGVASSNKRIIFDWSDNSFACVAYNATLTDTQGILLLLKTDYEAQGQFTEVVEVVCPFQVAIDGVPQYALQTELNELEDSLAPFPSYFADNVAAVVAAASKDIAAMGATGESVVFITDIHYESNAKKFPGLIKYLCDNLSVSGVIFGGDAINGNADRDTAIGYLNDVATGLRKGKGWFASIVGNHDSNNQAGGTEFANGVGTYFATVQRNLDRGIWRFVNYSFYFDDAASQTRFICINTGTGYNLSQGQKNWIGSVLTATDADTHIVIVMHAWLKTTNVKDGTTFIGYDFSQSSAGSDLDTIIANNSTKKIEAVLSGHAHLDYNGQSTGSVPVIVSDCDGKSSLMWEATEGTATEQSFDVVTFNYDTKTIYCRRIGRGKSRIIHYGANAMAVSDTLDISSLISIVPTSYSVRDNNSVKYRNAAGGGPSVTFGDTLASISNAGVVTAVAAGLVTAIAENDDCIETFNIQIA